MKWHMGDRRHLRVVRTGWRGHDEQLRRSKASRRRSWLVYVPVWAGAALLGTAYGAGWLDLNVGAPAQAAVGQGVQAEFSMCFTGGGYNCVVDGDTIWLQGTKIRIADIDTPETHEPRCEAERELGTRASARLHALLNSGAVTLQAIDRDEDRYGRKLRRVLVNGTSVGDTLVEEGLARPYRGGRRPWC
jgi:endonuclease YncB( thermonuclease family)